MTTKSKTKGITKISTQLNEYAMVTHKNHGLLICGTDNFNKKIIVSSVNEIISSKDIHFALSNIYLNNSEFIPANFFLEKICTNNNGYSITYSAGIFSFTKKITIDYLNNQLSIEYILNEGKSNTLLTVIPYLSFANIYANEPVEDINTLVKNQKIYCYNKKYDIKLTIDTNHIHKFDTELRYIDTYLLSENRKIKRKLYVPGTFKFVFSPGEKIILRFGIETNKTINNSIIIGKRNIYSKTHYLSTKYKYNIPLV